MSWSWPRLFKYWVVYPWNKLLSVALISIKETNFVINRPFHVFFFNFWHGIVSKKSSTLLEKAPLNNEHIAPQNREILQKFVWWEANVCKLSRLCKAISSHAWDVSLSNLAILLIKGALFCGFDGFSLTGPSLNRGRVCWLEIYPVDSVIHLLNNLALITQHNVNASNLLKWNFNIPRFQRTACCKFKGFLPSFHSQKPLSCWIRDSWSIPPRWKLPRSTPRHCSSLAH